MYKFRKFHQQPGPAGLPLTVEDDPRFTSIGRFLALTKLDELPQFWNVLKGDMSIVGPRAESLDFEDCFDGPYRAVLQYKPGVFGPSQALFRNEGCLYCDRPDPERFYRDVLFPLKAHIDLAYFAHRTFFNDIAWVIWGALAVFGYPAPRRAGALLVEKAEHAVSEGRQRDCDLPARIGSPMSVGCFCSGEIARKGETKIPGPTGPVPRSQTIGGKPSHQVRRSTGRTAANG